MSVFNTAIKALFNDSNLAVDATFVPQIGVSKVVRVITRRNAEDCPTVSQRDQFIINAVTYTAQGMPRRDSERLFWQVDVYAT